MEADEPKMSFSPRRESPFSPASPCFPGWAATICLEVVAEEMLPKLASAEVFHWEARRRLLQHRLCKPPTLATPRGLCTDSLPFKLIQQTHFRVSHRAEQQSSFSSDSSQVRDEPAGLSLMYDFQANPHSKGEKAPQGTQLTLLNNLFILHKEGSRIV